MGYLSTSHYIREQFGIEQAAGTEPPERRRAGTAGPGAAYKQLEDYVDEINALKKVLAPSSYCTFHFSFSSFFLSFLSLSHLLCLFSFFYLFLMNFVYRNAVIAHLVANGTHWKVAGIVLGDGISIYGKFHKAFHIWLCYAWIFAWLLLLGRWGPNPFDFSKNMHGFINFLLILENFR